MWFLTMDFIFYILVGKERTTKLLLREKGGICSWWEPVFTMLLVAWSSKQLLIKCNMKADYWPHQGLDSTQPQHKQPNHILNFYFLHSHWNTISIETIDTSLLSLFLICKANLNHLPFCIFSFLELFAD